VAGFKRPPTFDIHETVRRFHIDPLTTENMEVAKNMFQAKRVPLEMLRRLEEERDFHRQDWDAVRDTVDPSVRLREFEFYFEFVADLCRKLANALCD